MNAKDLSRDLRRLAQREVPREPDLWPVVRARVAGTSRTHGAIDGTSSYVWHADAQARRWGTAARIAGASLVVVLLVVALAALFNQQQGGDQPAALGGQSSPVGQSVASATPSATTWSAQGEVDVPIEPFHNSRRLQGTATGWLFLSGDLDVSLSLTNAPDTLFWHVLTGECSSWSGLTEKDAFSKDLASAFASAPGATVVPARTVIPTAQTHQSLALVAFDADNKGSSVGCAAIPAVPNGFTVSTPIDPSVPSTCAVTRPSVPPFIPSDPEARNPPGPSDFWYGTDDLRTALPLDGVWPHVQKIFWQSTNYQGEAPPDISVTGQRLDGDSAPLEVDRPTTASGAGIGQSMLVAVTFPTAGCWQVTAEYAGHSLSFVVWIAGQWTPSTPNPTIGVATPTSADLPFPVTSLTSPAQPSTCTPSTVGQLLANFVDAFNAGDQTRLRALFPDHDSSYVQSGVARDQYSLFQTFNQNEFLGPQSWGADNRADLLNAFARRHAAHERWTMVSVKYGQVSNDAAFIQPTFTAQADDLSLRTFQGRGAINCAQGWISTWVMSDTDILKAPSPTNIAPVPTPDTGAPFTLPPLPQLPLVPGDRLGSTCGPQDAGNLILRFIKAVNDGDQATLAALFPDIPAVIVDQGEVPPWTADGRAALLAKLAELRQQGTWESQRIIAASQAQGAAIQFNINVITGDPDIFTLSGVGLVNCDTQQIVAWQMTESQPIPSPTATPATTNVPVPLAQGGAIWEWRRARM
jgi:hypothetical protein